MNRTLDKALQTTTVVKWQQPSRLQSACLFRAIRREGSEGSGEGRRPPPAHLMRGSPLDRWERDSPLLTRRTQKKALSLAPASRPRLCLFVQKKSTIGSRFPAAQSRQHPFHLFPTALTFTCPQIHVVGPAPLAPLCQHVQERHSRFCHCLRGFCIDHRHEEGRRRVSSSSLHVP